jgi:hypothetical protein
VSPLWLASVEMPTSAAAGLSDFSSGLDTGYSIPPAGSPWGWPGVPAAYDMPAPTRPGVVRDQPAGPNESAGDEEAPQIEGPSACRRLHFAAWWRCCAAEAVDGTVRC